MSRRPRKSIGSLRESDIPDSPGVYAIYRDGLPVYVGKARRLQNRIWKNHRGRGTVLTGSALRRNVAAELLTDVTAADIKARRYQPTDAELDRVRAWLDSCKVTWLEVSETAALELERAMKSEWLPRLTKR